VAETESLAGTEAATVAVATADIRTLGEVPGLAVGLLVGLDDLVFELGAGVEQQDITKPLKAEVVVGLASIKTDAVVLGRLHGAMGVRKSNRYLNIALLREQKKEKLRMTA
jgi:hypothetical protein